LIFDQIYILVKLLYDARVNLVQHFIDRSLRSKTIACFYLV